MSTIFDVLNEPRTGARPRSIHPTTADALEDLAAAAAKHMGVSLPVAVNISPSINPGLTRHDFPELDVDLAWRPWLGQVKPVPGWDAYALRAEEIARASSSPDMVRAVHGLPLSRADGREIPCPCDRCQRARLEVIAVCHASEARKQAELTHADVLADVPRPRTLGWLGFLRTSVALCLLAYLAYEFALALADWALLHYQHIH